MSVFSFRKKSHFSNRCRLLDMFSVSWVLSSLCCRFSFSHLFDKLIFYEKISGCSIVPAFLHCEPTPCNIFPRKGLTMGVYGVYNASEVISMSKGNPIIHARVTPDQLERLKAIAKERNIDLSTLIKQAIQAYLLADTEKNG